jgi:hypothetical protein
MLIVREDGQSTLAGENPNGWLSDSALLKEKPA